jgi:hypothetical protein
VHGGSGRLIDDHPTRSLGEQLEGLIEHGPNPLILGPGEGSDLDDGPGLQIPTLRVLGHDAPSHPHSAPRQQSANLRARQPQMFGKKAIEALPAMLF